MHDAHGAIRRLADHLRTGTPLPAIDRDLLATGLEEWLAERGEVPLDKVLGLRTWGGVSVSRAMVLAERDRLLTSLWRSSPEWYGLPPVAAARLISLAAQRYESDRWPRERNRVDAPAAEPAATFWRCLQLGVDLPRSRQLRRILAVAIQEGV